MEFTWMQNTPPFYYTLRASGQSEVWHDFTEEAKFRQYGWRCSTNEDSYSTATLNGNWYEKRSDTGRAKALRRPLPSQFSHYFDTTYSSSFNKEEKRPIYSNIKRESRIFPGHQPELDPPHTKCVPNSSYRTDFGRQEPNRSSDKQTPALQERREWERATSRTPEDSSLPFRVSH